MANDSDKFIDEVKQGNPVHYVTIVDSAGDTERVQSWIDSAESRKEQDTIPPFDSIIMNWSVITPVYTNEAGELLPILEGTERFQGKNIAPLLRELMAPAINVETGTHTIAGIFTPVLEMHGICLFHVADKDFRLSVKYPHVEVPPLDKWEEVCIAWESRNELLCPGLSNTVRAWVAKNKPLDDKTGQKDSEGKSDRLRKVPFSIQTSQEFGALEQAAADGSRGANYTVIENRKVIVHQRPGKSHRVEFGIIDRESREGYSMLDLDTFRSKLDADTVLALHCIACQVAPPPGTAIPQGFTPSGTIHIETIAEVLDPNYAFRSAEVRAALRRKAWETILFGTRARVIGDRTIEYLRPKTREKINTRVSSAPWVITDELRPIQPALFDETPEAVVLAVSKEWGPLLTDPLLAQQLRLGERLGMIPGGRPAGAWARVMGLTLASFYRRNPREAIAGTMPITRRELLLNLPPKVGDVEQMLKDKNPQRAINAYSEALALLVEKGLISAEAEAAPGNASKRLGESGAVLSGSGWQDRWLNTKVKLIPGKDWKIAVTERADALPPPQKPKLLGKPGKKPKQLH